MDGSFGVSVGISFGGPGGWGAIVLSIALCIFLFRGKNDTVRKWATRKIQEFLRLSK
jgi:hypothetical protein